MIVTAQALSQKFSSFKDTFARRWGPETRAWLEINKPQCLIAVEIAQASLDSAWTEVLAGRAQPIAFDVALIHWGMAHTEAVEAWEKRAA